MNRKDENPAALARRALDEPDSDGGIDPRLADALIEAIVDYPTFRTACAACGVKSTAVKSMLERGAQVGAPRSLREFSKRLARADADNAKDHYQAAQTLIARGMSAEARLMIQLLDRRWSAEDDNDIMAMLSGGRRSSNLQARLASPSPMLASLLTTMLRRPNEAWSSLLQTSGWVRAVPSGGEPAPATEGQGEPAEEPESPEEADDGSGL